ncbi:MAG: RloB family protein [Deltaproteobacteria bacterium]|nr:RloB family protein [Deltaproteobacteria bacterium]
MGKRKARKAESLHRRHAKRAPYAVVLIVCEGSKTEPNYFKGLKDSLRLSSANIIIADNTTGSDPLSVVNSAIKEFNKDPSYDRVYCVFDKDKHTTYAPAIDKIRSTRLKNNAELHSITSIPCFEIWLLLHYTYTTGSFCAAGNDSNCALVLSKLKTYIPDYEKGNQQIFKIVELKLPDALSRAKRLEEFHKTSGTDNPSTKIHKLVEDLMKLKK